MLSPPKKIKRPSSVLFGPGVNPSTDPALYEYGDAVIVVLGESSASLPTLTPKYLGASLNTVEERSVTDPRITLKTPLETTTFGWVSAQRGLPLVETS